MVQQNAGLFLGVGSVTKKVNVSIRSLATDNRRSERGVNCNAQVANGHLAVITDADASPLTKDEWPPGTGWCRPKYRAFLRQGLVTCCLRCNAQFTVNLVGIGMVQELIQKRISVL